MDNLPLPILLHIGEYIPRDNNMRSPTSPHIESLLYYYNDCDYQEISRLIRAWEYDHEVDDVPPRWEYATELFYKPFYQEPFYEYALRIHRQEKQGMRHKYPRYKEYNNNDIRNVARYYTSYTDTDIDAYSDTD